MWCVYVLFCVVCVCVVLCDVVYLEDCAVHSVLVDSLYKGVDIDMTNQELLDKYEQGFMGW